jgi:hypothetical protein
MPTTQDLRDDVARHLRDTLNERARAKDSGVGYTGLDTEIRNLAGALRELDAAIAAIVVATR